jgi:hypothetical protein
VSLAHRAGLQLTCPKLRRGRAERASSGEAGVGKSRLAYQLRERLASVPHTWLECGGSPYTGDAVPLQ